MAIPCDYGLFHIPNESAFYDFLSSFSAHYRPVHSYLSSAICTVGVVSNLCNIAVLTRKSMRTPVNVILCAIALLDLVVMLSNLVFIFHFTILMDCAAENLSYNWAVFMAFHAQVSVIGHSASVWLSVTMAFMRYMVIRIGSNNVNMCQAFRVTMIHAGIAILGVVCFVFICNVPNYVSYSITEHRAIDFFGDCGNFTTQVVYFTDKNEHARANECFLLRLAFWLNGLVLKMVPCVLLTFFMTVLLRVLSEVKERRMRLRGSACAVSAGLASEYTQCNNKPSTLAQTADHSGPLTADHSGPLTADPTTNCITVPTVASRRRCSAMAPARDPASDRTTRMLIAIICVFLATELPQGIMAIATGLFSMEFHSRIYKPLGDMFDILSLINSCATFVIYCSMSRQYRVEFRRMFLRDKGRWCRQCRGWSWSRWRQTLSRLSRRDDSRASTFADATASNQASNHIKQNRAAGEQLIDNNNKTGGQIPEIVIEPATVQNNDVISDNDATSLGDTHSAWPAHDTDEQETTNVEFYVATL